MNDTIINREQTQTQLRDADYESTLIIKESDYGDQDDSLIVDQQIRKSQSSTKVIKKVDRLFLDDNEKDTENRKNL